MNFFIGLAFFLFLQSIVALAAGLRFVRYALRPPATPLDRYRPKAAIIVPCKGLDADFAENVGAFFAQDYRDYELIFVTESESDPAYAVLGRLIKQSSRSAWLVVAGEAQGRGQKVHNLCAAIETLDAVDRRVEVLVFADADARPTMNWLAEIVAPLGDQRVGAATGFRWYLPVRGGFWSQLLSVWNASALTLLGARSAFAWGGATAIRRETFEQLAIKQQWQGAVSDDYVLTQAVRAAGQRIRFAPACLMASSAEVGWRELLEFTTRQMIITRVYAPRVWALALATHLLFNLTFWGGLVMLIATSLTARLDETLLSLLVGSFSLGAMTGWLRAVVASHLLPAQRALLQKHWWAYLLLGPVVSLLYLYNAVAAAFTRRIVWRGIGYEMPSPHETIIWHRPSPPSAADASAGLPQTRRASARTPSS